MISVVLPVFNGARYIESSVRSLLDQHEEMEIIVSDDCSTDNTAEIVRAFDSPSIKLILNAQRGGQFVNFNRGLRHCSGDYIQFFSHDDVAHPGFLWSQRDALQRSAELGMVYASCFIIDQNGRRIWTNDDEGTPGWIDLETYLGISARHGALPPSISTVMIRREIIGEIGPFDERFWVGGDLEFYNRVAERGPIARNRNILLEVRSHDQSVTANSASQMRVMEEELIILPFYRRHLSGEEYKKMLSWRSRHRGADHAKYILKRAFGGDVKGAMRAYRALSQVHNVPLCTMFAVIQKLRGAKA